ncbi:MAG: DUF1743 domain-containing protein [Fervidicoccaceae archaeon]
MKRLAVGLDGYDSNFSGCTTHFTVFLLNILRKSGREFKLLGGPFLVRLNPNVPFKTRGNAAVSFSIEGEIDEQFIERSIEEVAEAYEFEKKGTSVIIDLDKWNRFVDLVRFYHRSVSDLVPRKVAEELLEDVGGISIGRNSLVGALASVGYALSESEFTYELLVYRGEAEEDNRTIDEKKAKEILLSFPSLFNNVSRKRGKVVAIPRGPDPVLIGIRGYNEGELMEALKELVPFMERPSAWCLFKSNQHTDPHAIPRKIEDLRVYRMGVIEGVISEKPDIKMGGHVIVYLDDERGMSIPVIFYSETYPMNVAAAKLRRGDRIAVLGGAVEKRGSDGLIFEAEKLWIKDVSNIILERNPRCPVCGARMESAGREKGYRCPKCGYRARGVLAKEKIVVKRDLQIASVSPLEGRIRHLVKPSELEHIALPRITMGKEGKEIHCSYQAFR